jgi:hypothetical protein
MEAELVGAAVEAPGVTALELVRITTVAALFGADVSRFEPLASAVTARASAATVRMLRIKRSIRDPPGGQS